MWSRVAVVIVSLTASCHGGLLGAGTGEGSCAAAPFRAPAGALKWALGCPAGAECCSEYGYCRAQSEWVAGAFRDCNGVSNGRPLAADAIAAENEAAAYGDVSAAGLIVVPAGASGYAGAQFPVAAAPAIAVAAAPAVAYAAAPAVAYAAAPVAAVAGSGYGYALNGGVAGYALNGGVAGYADAGYGYAAAPAAVGTGYGYAAAVPAAVGAGYGYAAAVPAAVGAGYGYAAAVPSAVGAGYGYAAAAPAGYANTYAGAGYGVVPAANTGYVVSGY